MQAAMYPCRRAAPLLLLLLALCASQVAGQQDEDPDVLEFRAARSAAEADQDIEALYSLAYETEEVGLVSSEVAQLRQDAPTLIEQAFTAQTALLEAPKELLQLVALAEGLGSGAAVSAAALQVARAKAQTQAQAELASLLVEGDEEEVREALEIAKSAGVTDGSVGEAETMLQGRAAEYLRVAIEEGDVGNLRLAVAQAQADGVAPSAYAEASAMRNQKIGEAIVLARSSNDLFALAEAIAGAKSVPDAGMEDAIAGAEAQFRDDVAGALSSAATLVLSDSDQVRYALRLATSMNFNESEDVTIAAAAAAVYQEEKRATARADLDECLNSRNWIGLAEALQEARAAGLPSGDFSAAEDSLQQKAREVLQQASNASAGGEVDLELALTLGRAANLSDEDMAGANERVAEAARARLQEAQLPGASLAELYAAITAADLPSGDRTAGEAAFQVHAAAWLQQESVGAGGGAAQDTAATLETLSWLERGKAMLAAGQWDQAVEVLRTQVAAELQAATAAESMARLEAVLGAYTDGEAYFTFPGSEDSEEADAAATEAQQELGALLTAARDVRSQLEGREITLEDLRAATAGLSLAELSGAIDTARSAGHAASVLAPFEAKYTELEAAVAAAVTECSEALISRDIERMRQAVRGAELAGLDDNRPEVIQNLRLRVTLMEKMLANIAQQAQLSAVGDSGTEGEPGVAPGG